MLKSRIVFSFIGLLSILSVSAANETITAGWTEPIIIFPEKIGVRAKLDTGARTSSLHVPDYKRFKLDDQDWVEFEFTGAGGRSVILRRPVIRVARIKDLTGPSQARPVISLGICLGSVYRKTQVTLFDRAGFNFRMLLGRRYLDGQILVDVSRRRMTTPNCPNWESK